MLLSLGINNFTLVDQLEIDFATGMTAITGETGAGKSLVLDALGMALGDRADADLIRYGANRLEINAQFDTCQTPQAQAWLQDHDFDLNQQECLLRRTLTREGRSRGYINGSPATMQQLKALGEMLVDIHNQHEHQSLLRKDTHRTLLDNFAGTQGLAKSVQSSFQAWRRASEQLDALNSQSEELEAKRELLSFQLQELDQLALGEHELQKLEEEHQLLANAETILRDSHGLLELCQGESEFNLQQGLNQALQLLRSMSSKPRALTDAENLLVSASIEVAEAAGEVQRHLDSFELNPERLRQLDERLGAVHELARKHRILPTELYNKHQDLKAELDCLSGGSESIKQLTEEASKWADEYQRQASELSMLRKGVANEFAEAVNLQLGHLAMKGASLTVALTSNAEQRFSPYGMETVEFLVTTNPGQRPGPLAKIASGGELSRISLAIQVIAARHSAIPTLLFDEVDVGIGGATADVVGRLLKELGQNGQVICITHQPQVASCAHHHLLAEKSTSEHGAESQMTLLNSEQRMSEIARMLGGATITEKTLEHAREMVELGIG